MYHKSIYNHDFINIPKKRKYTHIQMSKKNTNFNSNSFQPANSTNSPPIQPMIGYIYIGYMFLANSPTNSNPLQNANRSFHPTSTRPCRSFHGTQAYRRGTKPRVGGLVFGWEFFFCCLHHHVMSMPRWTKWRLNSMFFFGSWYLFFPTNLVLQFRWSVQAFPGWDDMWSFPGGCQDENDYWTVVSSYQLMIRIPGIP